MILSFILSGMMSTNETPHRISRIPAFRDNGDPVPSGSGADLQMNIRGPSGPLFISKDYLEFMFN